MKKPTLQPGKPITIGEKYGYAMEITEQAEADAYFEECVQHCMSYGKSREDAEKIERMNLGYYAGYGYDRERVERLFRCQHPLFGAAKNETSPEQAFGIGEMPTDEAG